MSGEQNTKFAVFKTNHHIVEMTRYNAKFIKGTGPDAMSAVLLGVPGVCGEDMTFFYGDHFSIGNFTSKDVLSPGDLGMLKANPLVIEVFDYRTGRGL